MSPAPAPAGHPPEDNLARAARGSALNFAGSVVAGLSTFVLTVAVTRLVAPTEAGVFFAATSLFLVVTGLGRLGTDTGLVYFISGARARGQLRHAQAYMRVSARPVLVVSVALGAALVLLAGTVAPVLSPGAEDRFADDLRVLGLLVPAATALHLAVAGTRGLGTMRVSAVLDQMARPVAQLLLVVTGLVVVGSAAMVWAWAVVYVPLAVVAWVWWRRLRDRSAGQVRDPSFRPARAFWRFSWPRALASVTQQATQRLDIVLVAALAGLVEAAIYTAATRFVILGQLLARAVSLSTQPLLGETLAAEDIPATLRLYQATTAWLVLVTWPLYLVLAVFAPTALRIFSGTYAEGADALRLLAVTMLLATACGMVNMVLLMAGRSFWNLANLVLAFSVNMVVDVLLIPRIGLLGAAVGWAVALAVVNLLPLLQLVRWYGLHPFGRGTLRAMTTALLTFLLVPGTARLVGGQDPWALAVGVLLALVVYAGALALQREQLQLGLLTTAVLRRGRRSTAG